MVIPFGCRDGHIPSFEGNHLARVGRLAERQLSLDAWFSHLLVNRLLFWFRLMTAYYNDVFTKIGHAFNRSL